MQELNVQLLSGFGYVLLFLGLVGSVLPVLPGPFLIWLGAFLWAWGDGFERIGWPTLVLLGLLAIAAWSADLFLNTVLSRRAGASWRSIFAAIIGGLAGGIVLTGTIPVLGTLIGAAVGGLLGMLAAEYADKRSFAKALRALRAYVFSMVLASVVEVSIAFGMLGIFFWQAFL